jgi:hypothetical protein
MYYSRPKPKRENILPIPQRYWALLSMVVKMFAYDTFKVRTLLP